MRKVPEFVVAFASQAERLLQAKAVRDPLFSRGTYQFEVNETKNKEGYFPFLQMSDSGEVTDSFCSCAVSETGRGCPHLAAAYLKIFRGHEEPLHVRFEQSFWNRLFQILAHKLGYDSKTLLKEGEVGYALYSPSKKQLFSITPTTPAGKNRLISLIEERVVETEETSIKFSNLSAEDITEYRAGRASSGLLYDLSLWADLAKWLFFLQEEGSFYQISFSDLSEQIPHDMHVEVDAFNMKCYISDVMWPDLIASLSTVEAPLRVFEEEDHLIEMIRYEPALRSLKIVHRGPVSAPDAVSPEIGVGEWQFVAGKGFFRSRNDPLLQNEQISSDQISEVLSRSGKTLSRFFPVHMEPRPARYYLHFDAQQQLHIELYLESYGDLQQPDAALFAPWVYSPKNGFYRLSELPFDVIHKVISREKVAEFVNKHRLWLHNFPGFQTHLGSLEAHLTFMLSSEGQLSFSAELDFPEQFDETVDFGQWVYIKGSGFYMKKESRGRLPLHPGLVLKKNEISSFISAHREELEQVHGFFASRPIVLRSGLEVALNAEGLIAIFPRIEYAPDVNPVQAALFGDFVYVKDFGFAEIPASARLPERYQSAVEIPASQEAAFLAYELDPLRPYILSIDPRLQRPHNLRLKIRKIQKAPRRRGREWLVDLVYESDVGYVDVFTIWDTFQFRKRHLFSPAGLLSLKEARFNWLRQLTKRRLDRKKGMIRLNTLEWIRLSVFEDIKEPKGSDAESQETRKLLQELQQFETSRLIDLSRLKSQLRPYQETGLQWLWFLYCHGLSGLLCDDMGLGKTHQAMALLSAVLHEDIDKQNKYLVVCPTSVIYHWEELLKRFLPDLRVCTYYGLERSLESFQDQYDLLLTSYGILRAGRDDLRSLSFEVAIFDEIQIAKNSSSQTHAALKSLNAEMRLGLTGTPIENHIRELKALFDVALPGYMPTDAVFRELFTNPIEKFQDEEKKQLLSKLIKPFILRRKKSEVLLDLPGKIEEISYCDLSAEQKELYRETALSLQNTVYEELRNTSKPISYLHVFAALTKLKQICNHPSLIAGDVKKYHTHQSGKWDLFIELLTEARDSGQKIVIFSQYLDMLAIIEEYLKKKGIGYASIKGSTRDRSEQIRRFREDPACEVFVASLLAAGVGIDLTVASIVIHYDRWWNPAKENQATDRVHRIGQNRGVQVFKLVTKNTIEGHIHALIEQKKGLLEEIVGQDEADRINYLSRDELLHIFERLKDV